MDKKDAILSLLLLQNSRIRYREMAEKVNLSVNAVHKRIQSMIDLGVIGSFTTQLSLKAINAMRILIFGTTESSNLDDASKKLGESEYVYWVARSSGSFIYIGIYLKDGNEQ